MNVNVSNMNVPYVKECKTLNPVDKPNRCYILIICSYNGLLGIEWNVHIWFCSCENVTYNMG